MPTSRKVPRTRLCQVVQTPDTRIVLQRLQKPQAAAFVYHARPFELGSSRVSESLSLILLSTLKSARPPHHLVPMTTNLSSPKRREKQYIFCLLNGFSWIFQSGSNGLSRLCNDHGVLWGTRT
ncbi:hypothetical protein ABKN59_005131 [Abortiporus biennis]